MHRSSKHDQTKHVDSNPRPSTSTKSPLRNLKNRNNEREIRQSCCCCCGIAPSASAARSTSVPQERKNHGFEIHLLQNRKQIQEQSEKGGSGHAYRNPLSSNNRAIFSSSLSLGSLSKLSCQK